MTERATNEQQPKNGKTKTKTKKSRQHQDVHEGKRGIFCRCPSMTRAQRHAGNLTQPFFRLKTRSDSITCLSRIIAERRKGRGRGGWRGFAVGQEDVQGVGTERRCSFTQSTVSHASTVFPSRSVAKFSQNRRVVWGGLFVFLLYNICRRLEQAMSGVIFTNKEERPGYHMHFQLRNTIIINI